METAQINVTDLPLALRESVTDTIRYFSTFFLVKGEHAGSGTFAKVNGVSGILTARHVWDGLVKQCSPGEVISIAVREDTHRFEVILDSLKPSVGIALNEADEAAGPDVEFIQLPAQLIERISDARIFYDLNLDSANRLELAQRAEGVSALIGFQASGVILENNLFRGKPLKTFHGQFFFAGRTGTEQLGEFDYFDITLPSDDYRGISGAGIWRVTLAMKNREALDTVRIAGCALAGVAFYQGSKQEKGRQIRCHGPLTIYEVLPKRILTPSSPPPPSGPSG